ncbi:MAG TPA: cbb3-type cytochrome c oxidase subunit I [Ignavibacteriaceae bacterium]|jgi:heme/copper-type cytochrome/quinol oxidase subunit 1|nr:cbb3-type cytochrome c oxidase subunit I [Ignavibacteriaceae bacterium]
MFTTVRYFIKTSVIFLITGILTGVYMSLAQNVFHTAYGIELKSAHTHIILVGSVMMMIMGVALWFFPRPQKDDKKYNPDKILIAYWMMTISTALRFISQAAASFFYSEIIAWSISLYSLFQVAAIIYFFYAIWGRIRPVGSQIREAKGEKF